MHRVLPVSSARPYDLLLLDFGGVCLQNPVEMHSRVEQRLGLAPGTFEWLGPVDPETDELWRRMIGGELTEREYWRIRAAEVGEAAGAEMSTADYMTMLYDPPTPEMVRPDAVATVEAARAAGIAVSLLTNDMRAFHGPTWEQGVDFLRLIDHIADCSDTDILKPDPRAFERAADMTGVGYDRTLFVDDQPLNVAGAEAVGLDTIWFDIAKPADSWARVADHLDL